MRDLIRRNLAAFAQVSDDFFYIFLFLILILISIATNVVQLKTLAIVVELAHKCTTLDAKVALEFHVEAELKRMG